MGCFEEFFCIEMPHITHKTHRNEAGFDGLPFSYQFLLYVMLKFAIEREKSQVCLGCAEPTNEARAEDACILCLVRRRKTKST